MQKNRCLAAIGWCSAVFFAVFVCSVVNAGQEQEPFVAIIIDDMGAQTDMSRQALALPGQLTFSFLPETPQGAMLAQEVHASGREVMLHVPMETVYHDRLRSRGIRSRMTGKAIAEMLHSQLLSVPHVRGVNNHMGSYVTQQQEIMRPVMSALRAWQKRPLYFVDSMTSASSIAYVVAKEYGLAAARRHIFLDHQFSRRYINQQLDKLIALAKKEGYALAIGHPRPVTLSVLRQRLQEHRIGGVRLVSVSTYLAALTQSEPAAEVVKNSSADMASLKSELELF